MDQVPSKKLKKFFATSRPIYYKKGDIVLRIGESHASAYFLKSGYVKDSCLSPDGKEFTLFIFKPGNIFSYNWIFNRIPNEHTFRAMMDCVIYEKSREGLLLFLEQNSDVQFMISQNIVTRLRGLMQRMEHLAFGTAFQKVGSILFILAERFGKNTSRGIYIPITLTQLDIAELIGLSRETTSIEIKKLMDLGLVIRTSRNYIVTNMINLQEVAELKK